MRSATLVLLAAASQGCSAADAPDPLPLPEVLFDELVAGGPAAAGVSRGALSALGALAVVGVPSQDATGRAAPLGEAAREALGAWAGCLQQGGAAAAHSSYLARGAVRRTSVVAGGRWGRTEDAASAFPGDCPPAQRATSAMRYGVRAAARAVAAAVDSASAATQAGVLRVRAVRGPSGGLGAGAQLLRPDAGRGDLTLAEALELGSHLEHIRLYEENRSARGPEQTAGGGTEAMEALSLHTDAGLMLAFVPPPTQAGGGASLVELQLPGGEVRELALPSQGDAVIFLAGQAAHLLWRQARAGDEAAPGLRPAPHALRLRPGFGWRAWYGVMLLPPKDARVKGGDEDAGDALTFGQMWSAARMAVTGQPSAEVPALLGCGEGQQLADQVGGCAEGEIECWMNCVSVSHLQDCKGGMWRPTGVGDLAEFVNLSIQCVDTKTGAKYQTGQHCLTCQPTCTLSSSKPGPPGPPRPTPEEDSVFCRTTSQGTGATMYMDGFKITSLSPDAACVNFLLPSLVIDRPWKLILASLGVVLLSACVEICAMCRRFLPKERQGDVGLVFHLVSLVLAYVAMLFVMSYSVELFLSVIAGLAVGHKAAGAVARSEARDLFGGSPCCRLAAGLDVSARPSTAAADAGAEPTSARSTEGLTTVRLSVRGMTCGACAETVRRALEGVWGVHSARVSLQDASADVLCEPSGTMFRTLCDVCSSLGFDTGGADEV